MLSATDLLLVSMRWLHASAAAVWLGAVIVELLSGHLAEASSEAAAARAVALRDIVQTSLVVFLVSGAILTFDRLSHGAAGTSYVTVLAVKLLLSVAMFQIAFRFRRASGPSRLLGLRLVAVLGLIILFLAGLLKSIYERALLA